MAESAEVPVALGLGANLGDARRNLHLAIRRLRTLLLGLRVSTIIETVPEQCQPGAPPFLNAAAVGTTDLSPRELLRACQGIEEELGRPAGRSRGVELYADRPIDIDILLFDDQQVADGETLIVPHPQLTERSFALEPLAELVPEWRIPGDGRTVAAALAELQAE